VKIKQRTRDYWNETLIALYKSWPELHDTQLRNIRQTDLEKWAGEYAKTASATRYHNTVHLVRHVLNVGVAAGVLGHNAANALHRISYRDNRRSNWALMTTMIVLSNIKTAPIAAGSTMPHGARTPAASGIAKML
jgi:hypothetical protein